MKPKFECCVLPLTLGLAADDWTQKVLLLGLARSSVRTIDCGRLPGMFDCDLLVRRQLCFVLSVALGVVGVTWSEPDS